MLVLEYRIQETGDWRQEAGDRMEDEEENSF
jgi:hypothetical protein